MPTRIEWTDETWNLHPERLEQPLHWKKPRMIFVNSISDLFHENVSFDFIDKIFAVMGVASNHTFQILTKSPKRMLEYINDLIDGQRRLGDALIDMGIDSFIKRLGIASAYGAGNRKGYEPPYKPFPNVWLGISCENQETADERIPLLLQVPAAVRFLSCEPLLDKIDLTAKWCDLDYDAHECETVLSHIDWIIVGGESGPEYRPMNLDWARSIRNQCVAAGVPFFFKQTAGKKEIPPDLIIREYPQTGFDLITNRRCEVNGKAVNEKLCR